ncbi:hypothetical protein OIU76_007515 [Salix suchowensis]|uniref:Uncharacterized protein n=1 Tax=Salix suchowensis TaxID=1278906 RepID=A0ABQ9BVF0_9ROSI|nr:hypothetical protein OIU76_007515 [Salix suchowensis]KAJ6391151.1 hypothetical protein OIU77_025191 [Salix suchowensis]
MGVFHHEEAPNPSKKCKFLAATLKDVFSNCDACCGWISSSGPDEDYPITDVVDESEVIVSEIRSRAMEKLRHKPFIFTDSFSWVYSPKTGELFVSPKAAQQKNDANDEYDDTREEFFSVGSCLSCCSSALSREAFVSAEPNSSRCPSFDEFDFPKRSILQEFCQCQGWPFGLCRKAVLLPPLPKSPSESWSWRKGARIVKMA